jgi:hypothetical protein
VLEAQAVLLAVLLLFALPEEVEFESIQKLLI